MVIMSLAELVEKLRDVQEGQNTLVTLDELANLGLNIVVLGKDVKTPSIERNSYLSRRRDEYDAIAHKKINDYCYLVDRKWVSEQVLGEGAQDDDSLKPYEDSRKQWSLSVHELSDRSSSHGDWEKRYRREQELKHENEQRLAEFLLYRPTALTDLMRKSDVIVAPPELVDKINQEFPDSRIALYVDGNDSFNLIEPARDPSYLRVLVRAKEGFEARIDMETINILFNPGTHSEIFGKGFIYAMLAWDGFGEGTRRHLQEEFYSTLKISHAPPVARRGISDKHAFVHGYNAISNFYSYGGHTRGSRERGRKFLDRLWKDKEQHVTAAYEQLWTTPLDSIEEALDRQKLLTELVEDSRYLKEIDSLESAINNLLEPHLHLSGMAKHISANILGSRWGARIYRDAFYSDFLGVARKFVETYDSLMEHVGISSKSREMSTLLALLNEFVDAENEFSLRRTYRFLKSVLDAGPKDFNELSNLFKVELGRSGSHLLWELEEYDGKKDPNLVLHYDVLVRSSFTPRTLDENKTDYLAYLINKFHSQNPVTSSEPAIRYLDHVSSKLAAYKALAHFIKGSNWAKPEILPAEEGIVDLKNGYYPLLPVKRNIPNDTYLDADNMVEIIEGTNKGGKTVDALKAMFIVTCALTGNYIPAESARISFFDKVRFKIKQTGMYDTGALAADLGHIKEAIMALGTPSLIVLDETFTSTNAREGEALTYALITRILEEGNARAIVTSHYPTLQDLVVVPGVRFSHFEFERSASGLSFSHKKISGPNLMGDYAIAIAEDEGIDPRIIAHARAYHERWIK